MDETQPQGPAVAAELKIDVVLFAKLADFTKCDPVEGGLWPATKLSSEQVGVLL
ncbi:hypothetical protein I6I07_21155 [Achromobacter deleyi]|uniref:Uncharacterized protein n=1 Tax=Achromobacter deleyi TaxID=1353891 RepID=A0A7T4B020_9BURK|nr:MULTISPECIES: hypothetical protein [Alcaligenaceae]QQB33144.1 hypothetical protein I6I07_21155 [Achromobacter deleyi]